MKRRIVILSAFLTPFRSGAEACAEEVALRLSDRYDITIITAKLRHDLPRSAHLSICPSNLSTIQPSNHLTVRPSVQVLRVGLGCSFDKWLYPLLAPFAARKLKPDIIHAVLETFAGLALHVCRLIVPRAKKILTLQTTNRNFLRSRVLRTPDVVTAISKHLADQAATFGRKDVVVIPNGIPYEEIRKACENVKKVPGRILFVGRLEKMKGVDVLLKAFATVEKSQPAATLHIAGEGSQRKDLENLKKELGIQNCHFLGYIKAPELYEEYAEAQIFCGLSRSEALGNVFLEAQAAGCAIVFSVVGGIPETLPPELPRSGWGVNYDDGNEKAAREAGRGICAYLTETSLRQDHAEKCISHSKAYDWNAIANRYAAQYDHLLSRTA